MNEKKNYTFYGNSAMMNRLKKLADRKRRSLGSMIVEAIEKFLKGGKK